MIAHQQSTMLREGLLLDGAELLALQQQINGPGQIGPIRGRRQPPDLIRVGVERKQPVARRRRNHPRAGNVGPFDQCVSLPPLRVVLDPDNAPCGRQEIGRDAGPAQISAGRREGDMGRRCLNTLPQRETASRGCVRSRLVRQRFNRSIGQRHNFRWFQRHGVERMLAPGYHCIDPQRQPAPEPGFGLAIVRIGQADLSAHDQIGLARWFPGDEQALSGLKLPGSGADWVSAAPKLSSSSSASALRRCSNCRPPTAESRASAA